MNYFEVTGSDLDKLLTDGPAVHDDPFVGPDKLTDEQLDKLTDEQIEAFLDNPWSDHADETAATRLAAPVTDVVPAGWERVPVTPEHAAELIASAVPPDVALRHGVRSATSVDELPEWARPHGNKILPALLHPWTRPDGTTEIQIKVRPNSLKDMDGEYIKYLFEKGRSVQLGVLRHPEGATHAVVAEGTKQSLALAAYLPADVAVYRIAGCWGWSKDHIPTPDLAALCAMDSAVIPDADAARKRAVYDGVDLLGRALRLAGAAAVSFPRVAASGSTGIDDVLGKLPEEERAGYLERWFEETRALGKAASRPADRRPTARDEGDMPAVDISNEALAFEPLSEVLAAAGMPKLYLRGPRLTRIDVEDEEGVKRPVLRSLDGDMLRAHFAEHVNTFAVKLVKDADGVAREVESPKLVDRSTCATILGRATLPGIDPLKGIATAPFLRADGSLCQAPGYDAASGVYLHPRLEIAPVSLTPSSEGVAAALALLKQVLGDFPWVAKSDRAQFAAALFVTLLRRHISGPTPLWMITAPVASSGKSLLSSILASLYGNAEVAWDGQEPELRKAITSTLVEAGEPVAVLDNLPTGTTVGSATLARLLTSKLWGDRLLGGNLTARVPNDKLWIVNGNRLKTGGDLATRTVLVRLDPKSPNPDRRRDFVLGDLGVWLSEHAAKLLRALLVLAVDWINAGAPREEQVMRGFTPWTSALAGLLHHHGISGFFADRDETSIAMDAEKSECAALLAAWREAFRDDWVRTGQVLGRAPVFDLIPRDRTGVEPTSRSFGAWLGQHEGVYYGNLRVVSSYDKKLKQKVWMVEKFATDSEQ